MRPTLLSVLALTGVLLAPAAASAQRLRKAEIRDVKVGLKAGYNPDEVPDSRYTYLFKAGLWTPVTMDIAAGDEELTGAVLVIETTDSDDVQNNFNVPVPPLQPRETMTLMGYTKPGSLGSEIIVTLRDSRGREIEQRKKVYDATPLEDLTFLAAGTHLNQLRQSLLNEIREQEGDVAAQQRVNLGVQGRVAYADSVDALPTQWFGYNQVDLMILSTANNGFVETLMNRAEKTRQQALSDWVRRGGRLVISAGRNHDLAAALLKALQMDPLPVEFVAGGMQVEQLQAVQGWTNAKERLQNAPDKDGKPTTVEIAKLKLRPGADVQILIPLQEDVPDPQPLVVRVPYGVGQITVTAFDLDAPPFSRWSGQAEFWKKFRNTLNVGLPKAAPGQNARAYSPYNRNDNDDLAGQLRNKLEEFPDVSNISFGWVALFIFLYILVVGPLDYFFLKKVVKRLELTWVTFPAVVIVVSTVSYFTAYALKGNDLLINKVDLVDIDLEGKAIYGRTWFTLFSPRIQHYTIGVEPATPVWSAAPPNDQKSAGVTVSWMGRPDTSYGGFGRTRSQSLFRRAYNYTLDASGLEGVPIQVWSMKSFGATWERPIEDAQLPFVADLRSDGQGSFSGTITNRLPVALEGVSLIYGGGSSGGNVFNFNEPLQPNVATPVTFKPMAALVNWTDSSAPQTTGPGGVSTMTSDGIFKRLLFYNARNTAGQAHNLSLRELDEYWRVQGLKQEVILFARLPRRQEAAETVSQDPANPSRLWLGQLPGPNVKRPELLGTLKQDTYVRVYLSVKAKQ